MKAVIYMFDPEDEVLRFTRDFPQLQWAAVNSPVEAARELADADIFVLGNRVCGPELGAAMKSKPPSRLRWMHFTTAGIDRGLEMGLPASCTITNASGVRAGMVAQHAFALLLALKHGLPAILAAQGERKWMRQELQPMVTSLVGATACIVGMGPVGRVVARKLKAFDVHVRAVTRRVEEIPFADVVFSRDALVQAASDADILLICTAADHSTRHIVDETVLNAMKPSSLLINVARGEIVDEKALLKALRNGHLAGAGLDVMACEPATPDDPLWTAPNVIISPHVAGGASSVYEQQKRLFSENLQSFMNGKPLANQIREATVPA